MVSIDIPTSSSSGISPYAMYRKLQQTAEKNAANTGTTSTQDAVNKQLLDARNAAIRVRNSQTKVDNALTVSDATYFKNRVASATSVASLVNDDRVLRVLANANGLGDLFLFNKQRLKDVLTSDLTNPNSTARQGSTKELELAKKYNLGALGNLTDVNGAAVTVDANGKVQNNGTGTPLEAGLAKLKNLVVNNSGFVTLNSDGSVLQVGNAAGATADAFTKVKTKAIEKELTLPAATVSTAYEYDGPEFQRFRTRVDVQREEEYFKTAVKGVKSVEDFFADKRLMRFVLSAYDLESEQFNTGKIRQILESDLSDPNSLANRFQDPRFKQLAEDLNFAAFKEIKLKTTATVDKIVGKYERVKYEQSLDEQAPGVRAAIEFKRRAKDVTQTLQLLGDSVLREVVTVANNIPKQLAIQEVDSQVTALERKVDVKKFKDAAEVDKMVVRYLTNKAAESSGGSGSYLLNLFG
jgi:hypothetical protein